MRKFNPSTKGGNLMCKCSRCSIEIDINEAYFSALDDDMLSLNYYCPGCWDYLTTKEKED